MFIFHNASERPLPFTGKCQVTQELPVEPTLLP